LSAEQHLVDEHSQTRRTRRALTYDLGRWATELRPQLQLKQQTLTLDLGAEPLLPVLCDRAQIRHVVVRLVAKAHTLTGPRGRITVRARHVSDFLRIEIEGKGAADGHAAGTDAIYVLTIPVAAAA
jgi:signal transduction histidine kinase